VRKNKTSSRVKNTNPSVFVSGNSRLKAYLLYYSSLGKYLHYLQKRSSIRSSEHVFLE